VWVLLEAGAVGADSGAVFAEFDAAFAPGGADGGDVWVFGGLLFAGWPVDVPVGEVGGVGAFAVVTGLPAVGAEEGGGFGWELDRALGFAPVGATHPDDGGGAVLGELGGADGGDGEVERVGHVAGFSEGVFDAVGVPGWAARAVAEPGDEVREGASLG
jgi:hypothetical protein